MTRIAAISDIHGHLPVIPECDLLIIAGDICPNGSEQQQAYWMAHKLKPWLKETHAKEIVAVAGNHDHLFQNAPHLVPHDLCWHYLQDSSISLFDFEIYGTPWQLHFWGSFNASEKDLAKKYALIPNTTTLLISHGPPFGIMDTVTREPISSDDEVEIKLHTGSTSLRDKIFQIKPKMCFFGHIHDCFGIETHEEILFANVSYLDDALEESHKITLLEF